MNILKRMRYNSPVIITFAIISFIALWLDRETDGASNFLFFSVYRSSLADPLTYLRLFTHVLGHSSLEHWSGNMMVFLLLGPMLEEKYGSRMLLGMFGVVAWITGLVNIIFFPNTMLLGASGLVYMMIIMSSIVSVKKGEVPLTFVLIAVLYLGQEIYDGLFTVDNISHLSHMIGAVIGCAFAYMRSEIRRERR